MEIAKLVCVVANDDWKYAKAEETGKGGSEIAKAMFVFAKADWKDAKADWKDVRKVGIWVRMLSLENQCVI